MSNTKRRKSELHLNCNSIAYMNELKLSHFVFWLTINGRERIVINSKFREKRFLTNYA